MKTKSSNVTGVFTKRRWFSVLLSYARIFLDTEGAMKWARSHEGHWPSKARGKVEWEDLFGEFHTELSANILKNKEVSTSSEVTPLNAGVPDSKKMLALLSGLDLLPQEVLRLHLQLKFSDEMIAKVLKRSLPEVHLLLHEGLKELKRRIKEMGR